MSKINRRNFIRTSLMGGAAAAFCSPLSDLKALVSPDLSGQASSRVSLVTGGDRADIAFRALQPFSAEIARAIGRRRVVIKPNNVSTSIQLAATHAETLEGILEFLRSIKKLDNVIIAESAASGPAIEGYSNFGYLRLAEKYPVKLIDLDQEKHEILYVFDEKDFSPHPVRFSSILLSPDSYLISAAKMKTHDRVIVTLSLKNIIFGAPVKDPGFSWGKTRREGAWSDKAIVHGSGFRGINYNLFDLAPRLHPHLALIDGFDGMEGNGPSNGTPVDHRICIASTDWLAADRVATGLMGVDFDRVGYLSYCARTNQGVADLSKIEILGERISDHIRNYKLHSNIESQLTWMQPAG
jgi:uncharacterized protein (DUF362 family)